jgi:hypothetical protein
LLLLNLTSFAVCSLFIRCTHTLIVTDIVAGRRIPHSSAKLLRTSLVIVIFAASLDLICFVSSPQLRFLGFPSNRSSALGHQHYCSWRALPTNRHTLYTHRPTIPEFVRASTCILSALHLKIPPPITAPTRTATTTCYNIAATKDIQISHHCSGALIATRTIACNRR